MKNTILKISLKVLLIFFATINTNAQQKTTVTPYKEDTIITTLKKADIVNWLKSQITSNTKVRNEFVAKILDNALFNEMYLQRKGPDVNSRIIIVPLKTIYFSQHINKTEQKPFQNLVVSILRENNVDKIFTVNLSLIYPSDKNIKKLPRNTFNNFFKQYEPIDGTYALVSIFLADSKYVETDIKNGERVQYRGWRSKKVDNASDSNSRMWYLETTDIIKDSEGKLSTKTKTEDLGISNTVSPPKFKGDIRTKEYDK